MRTAVATIFASMIFHQAVAQDDFSSWNRGFELYGWLPDIEITTESGTEIDLSIDEILDNLDFTLQGTVFASRGDWSVFFDGVYMGLTLNDSISTSEPVDGFGRVDIGVDAEIEQDTFVSTFGAGYKFFEDQRTNLKAIGGLRYLHIDLEVDAKLEGNAQVELLGQEFSRQFEEQLETDGSGSNWDVIVGIQGETKINDDWTFVLRRYRNR